MSAMDAHLMPIFKQSRSKSDLFISSISLAMSIELKQALRAVLRAQFRINESRQNVFKFFSSKCSGIVRRCRRILLPEPALLSASLE
jgi:hypothetical protein